MIAIDGSLFEHYPHFSNRIIDTLLELIGISADHILLKQVKDHSGKGAALAALMT